MVELQAELQASIDAITKKLSEGKPLEKSDLEVLFLATYLNEEQRERSKS